MSDPTELDLAVTNVRRLSARAAKVARERDEAIVAARRAGASLRQLASHTGLSHETVRNITRPR
jgi:hypothetical protein